MVFNIGGRKIDISRADLAWQALHMEPAKVLKKGFYVRIDGKVFFLKTLVAAAAKVPPEGLTTLDAYNISTQLGYEVIYNCKITTEPF